MRDEGTLGVRMVVKGGVWLVMFNFVLILVPKSPSRKGLSGSLEKIRDHWRMLFEDTVRIMERGPGGRRVAIATTGNTIPSHIIFQ